jgi:hypothetical protein
MIIKARAMLVTIRMVKSPSTKLSKLMLCLKKVASLCKGKVGVTFSLKLAVSSGYLSMLSTAVAAVRVFLKLSTLDRLWVRSL